MGARQIGLRQAEETAREEVDEAAMTLGCRILALEQRQPRALLLLALKQHAAKVRGQWQGATVLCTPQRGSNGCQRGWESWSFTEKWMLSAPGGHWQSA